MDSSVASLRESILGYESEEYLRSAQAAKLQLAREFIKHEAWDEALRVLRPLWHGMSWRREGWWDLTEEVGTLLRKVATQVGDGGTIVAVNWELMSNSEWILGRAMLQPSYILMNCSFYSESTSSARHRKLP